MYDRDLDSMYSKLGNRLNVQILQGLSRLNSGKWIHQDNYSQANKLEQELLQTTEQAHLTYWRTCGLRTVMVFNSLFAIVVPSRTSIYCRDWHG